MNQQLLSLTTADVGKDAADGDRSPLRLSAVKLLPAPASVGKDMDPLRRPDEERSSCGGGGGTAADAAAAAAWLAHSCCLTLRKSAANRLHRSSAFFSLSVRTLMCSTHWKNSDTPPPPGWPGPGSSAPPPPRPLASSPGFKLFSN